MFSKTVAKNDATSPDIFPVDEVNIDMEALYQLGYECGKNSRFLLDTNFKAEDFKKLYRNWIDKSISKEMATDTLVYIESGELIGFLTYKIENDSATATLSAVNENQQGKGIGKKLWNQMENILYNKNITKLIIPTQKENIQACNFYIKLGYHIDETTYIKHYWKNDTIQ